MGISGLLPLLKSIHKHTTLKKFAGQTIGVDGYGWLHRGAVACAIELALDKPTTKWIEFAVNRVRMLLDFGITPYLVFDGDALPSKAGTNQERRMRRDEAKKLGMQFYKAGKLSQAHQELQKATSITPYMARVLIEELKKMNVQYVVAPYEADAQLAYLERKGIVDGVLSEDSDLLVFGVQRLITKLNQYGECVEIERKDFPLCKEVSLAGWTDSMFRRMAILSGCDYLPNIEKMGLKTAYRFVRKYKDPEKVLRMVSLEGKLSVPAGYLEKFQHAELTFLHHRVFCPIQQEMVFLTEPDRGVSDEDMPYLGAYVDPQTAIGVACGDLNPRTKATMQISTLASNRPSLRENRRQTLGTPADLKQGISIDNFFKPQRTPLAELDPNSLTPSPSQQRLLERNRNASWEPRPVSSAPQLRRTASSLTPTSPASSTDRRAFLSRASLLSTYQPPKRQRLCSEAEDLPPSKEVKHSRFFAASAEATAVSPLASKRTRGRRAKTAFDVWSDDSVDDILMGLTDVHEVASPERNNDARGREELHDAAEDIEAVPQSSPVEAPVTTEDASDCTSQETSASSGNATQDSRDSCISADLNPEAFDDLLEFHVRKQNARLSQTFASQSPAMQARALTSLNTTIQPSAPIVSPEAPDDAVHRERSTTSPTPVTTLLKTFAYQSENAQRTALHSLTDDQTVAAKIEAARAALAQQRKQRLRNSVSSTMTASNSEFTSDRIRGSEDALVPNSEDESSEAEDGAGRPTVNLQKFAFQA